MSRTVTLGVLLLSSAATAGTLGDAPILGGTTATVGQFPNVVGMEVGDGLCTGTLIAPEWVLTAAHCIQGVSLSSIRVHFGTVNMFSNPGVVRSAVMAIPKPGFSTSSLGKNDIGLIKLNMPITDIKPVPVNLDPAKAPVGIKVTMVGFGSTAVGGGGSIGVEYTVEQTSIACQSFVGSNTDLLCFSQISGKGKCQGDSGGPSFAMIDGVFTQVGVTSFGDQNCQQFGADTRTDAEKAFLLQHIPQLECTTDADCPGKICFNRRCILTPFTEGGLGADCTGNGDCDSQLCANDGDNAYCSDSCTLAVEGSCPAGLECLDTGAETIGACWPVEDPGCCDASNTGARTGLVSFIVVGLILGRKRRRRR
jgi:transmembrane serine protease 9